MYCAPICELQAKTFMADVMAMSAYRMEAAVQRTDFSINWRVLQPFLGTPNGVNKRVKDGDYILRDSTIFTADAKTRNWENLDEKFIIIFQRVIDKFITWFYKNAKKLGQKSRNNLQDWSFLHKWSKFPVDLTYQTPLRADCVNSFRSWLLSFLEKKNWCMRIPDINYFIFFNVLAFLHQTSPPWLNYFSLMVTSNSEE